MLAPQDKVVIVAPRERQRDVIEALYEVRAAHLVDFHEGRDPYGLKIGRPLPEGSKASERLVRLRALVRALGLEGRAPARTTAVADVEARIDRAIGDLEVNVASAVAARDRVKQSLKEIDEREARLRPLAALPLRLEDYRGYETLRPYVGTTAEPVTSADLGPVARDSLLFSSAAVLALFVPASHADAAQDVLLRKGFREIEVPAGTGTPEEAIRQAGSEHQRLERELATAEADLERLAREHGDFLLAAEEHLSIEVEKAEAPLQFGSTEYAFVVEAWVPSDDVGRLRAGLDARVGEAYHIEVAHGAAHAHGEGHGDAHGAPADAPSVPEEAAHKKHDEEDLPPTKYRNPGFARPFEFFTSMFSTPRYGEVDPTLVLTLAFPVFYGFMISDLGYGVIMALLGIWMATKLKDVEGLAQLGVGIAVAGVVAIVFGGLVFHDAFGIPFDAHVPDEEIHHVEEEVAAHNAAHPDDPLTSCQYFAEHHGETTWGCILGGHLAAGHPPLSKIGDVATLLVLSILVAGVHLGLGLVFGFVNEWGHSKKHALAKASWLVLLLALFVVLVEQTQDLAAVSAAIWDGGLRALGAGPVVLGLLGLGIVGLVVTEGALALLELPSLLANILSYTRLAGVAVAKAAMAAAFNALFLVGMVLDPHAGIPLIVVGGLLVIVTQLVVLVLGILSSGIQAIRLNYVEFFTKFYKGGGVAFKPFGRARRFTTAPAQPFVP